MLAANSRNQLTTDPSVIFSSLTVGGKSTQFFYYNEPGLLQEMFIVSHLVGGLVEPSIIGKQIGCLGPFTSHSQDIWAHKVSELLSPFTYL